jgi:site-specific DNA-methyltransferase (adenine-specific)
MAEWGYKMSGDIYHGDCLEEMKTLPANHVDTIITDPPYGLSFMGKEWDKGVPGVPFWSEMLRVSKPGAMLLAFGGTRTFHRMTCAIEDAGWELRDCMMWLYGSGFPKSHNLHGTFEGWGTALKPAWEPIIVAMKPIEGTFAENAKKWGVAGLNVDGGRIGTGAKTWTTPRGGIWATAPDATGELIVNSKGRWPANLILDEEAGVMLGEPSRFFYCAKASKSERNAGCEGMPEVQTTDGCVRSNPESARKYQANSSLRNNHHPTVKPLKLMEYLCTLTKTPTGGIVLDPFAGSGTTGLACANTGRNYILIEREQKYIDIILARLEGK